MKIPALIPARGGSKGVPHKNIIRVHSYPLLAYTIVACKESSQIGSVFVSTDCEKISEVAREYDARILKRPSELAQDNSTDYAVISHFFKCFPGYDKVAYMRPTTPLRDPGVLDAAIQKLDKSKTDYSGLRSMHLAPEGPYKMLQVDETGLCKGFFEDFQGEKDYTNLPRQTFPRAYIPNGYIDIALRATAEELGTDFGPSILPHITSPTIEIDTSYELDLLRCFISMYGDYNLDTLVNRYPPSVEKS